MLGEILVAQGALGRSQLEMALHEQRRRRERGAPIRVGELLVEMGLVTADQLDRAIAYRELAGSGRPQPT